MPEISVVIPTYNRRAQLQRVLEALAGQDCPAEKFEVIVISDGSTDGTGEYLQTCRQPYVLRPLLQENRGVATARNAGIQAAGAECILFLDDDVVPSPQLVGEHLRSQQPQTVILGPMLTPPDVRLAPWVLWEQRMLEKQYADMLAGRWQPTARQFYTGNTSLAAAALRRSGGFDPAFRRAEDVELAYRLKDMGLRFVFNPAARGYHYAMRSYASWLAIARAYGGNDVIMTRGKGQAWLLPTVFREYQRRNALVRGLARLCLDRPALSRAATGLLRSAALAGARLGIEKVSRYAFSGIFNLHYYQGMCDALGGRAAFWEAAAHPAAENEVTI